MPRPFQAVLTKGSVVRVLFHADKTAAKLLRCDGGGTGAEKRIENDGTGVGLSSKRAKYRPSIRKSAPMASANVM